MNKKIIKKQESLSMLEEIKSELKSLIESLSDKEFDAASQKMIKNWGGALEKDKSAKLSPEDMFDFVDAGAAARADIESEFGEDEFMPMTDDEYQNLMGDIDEGVDGRGLFQIEDANGNIIKKHALVIPVSGVDKKGRVVGFGDDDQGRTQIIVSWEWPIEMRHSNPEEMGKIKVYPEDIVLANSKNMTDNFLNELDNCTDEQEQELEEARGLGHGVKNSGDRNVKLRDDHHEAPLTNLNESISNFFKNKVTKKQLLSFISEQAREIANKHLDN